MPLRETYPVRVDRIIRAKDIVLKMIPDNCRLIESKDLQSKPIRTGRALHQYILDEQTFWTPELIQGNPMLTNYNTYLSRASDLFDTMYDVPEEQIEGQLNAVLSNLSHCQINSQTKLAKTIQKFQGADTYFFYGFQDTVTGNTTGSNYYNYPSWHKGLIVGYGYRGAIQELYGMYEEERNELTTTAVNAKNEITEMMKTADEEYKIQDAKYKELCKQSEVYIKEKEVKIAELEANYKEKLAFEDPAEDWEALAKKHNKQGKVWIGLSITFAILIAGGLSVLIAILPKLYEDVKVFDIARDTAILTVISGVLVYVLRCNGVFWERNTLNEQQRSKKQC